MSRKVIKIILKPVEMEENMYVDEDKRVLALRRHLLLQKTEIVEGSGAKPASAKKKEQEARKVRKKTVKASVASGAMGGNIQSVEKEGEADDTQQDENPEIVKVENRRGGARKAKRDGQKGSATKAKSQKDFVSETQFLEYKERHPALKQRSNLPAMTEVTSPGAWEQAVVDDWSCFSMFSLDRSAMLRLDCKNVSFNVANRQVTIAFGCFHVVHRDNQHAVCAAAQFAAFGKLCCTTKGTMCP